MEIFILILGIIGTIISFILMWAYKSKLTSEEISIQEYNNAKNVVNNATISLYVFSGILAMIGLYYFIKPYSSQRKNY
jgi:formate/nitrite transporter FocA (FNT family)